jgi:AmmeMemoRadiSam system protein A
MNEEAKKELLSIARNIVEARVRGEKVPKFKSTMADLQTKSGAFVTIKNKGRLRGCLGQFTSELPLYQTVAEMAADSASRDPRFFSDPITPAELPEIDIEISVLSPMERIENPLDLELGKHGIYIKRGFYSGCFLPQVATETGWSKEDFLSNCCWTKAGLKPDAWKDKDTEVYVFTAEIIAEEKV